MLKKTFITLTLFASCLGGIDASEAASQGHGYFHHRIPYRTVSHRHRGESRRFARGYYGHAVRFGSHRARFAGSPAIAAASGYVQQGRASFYSGGRTASGSSVGSATCAHRSLPFGTRVLVTNLANARQAVLTVNDRGPFVRGRLLDVSRGAASILGMLHAGVSQIRMQVLGGAG